MVSDRSVSTKTDDQAQIQEFSIGGWGGPAIAKFSAVPSGPMSLTLKILNLPPPPKKKERKLGLKCCNLVGQFVLRTVELSLKVSHIFADPVIWAL